MTFGYRRSRTLLTVIIAGLLALMLIPAAHAGNGFDQYGYNDTARMFNGSADGLDGVNDGTYYGDPTYARDKLIMDWSAEWDRGQDENWTDPNGYDGAHLTNHWNGKGRNGSGETWHYAFVWIGDYVANPNLVPEGAYGIWGQFAVIRSHGTVLNEHFWDAHANPSGFGAYK